MWEGDLGDDYTRRNLEVADRSAFFETLSEYGLENIFELGCNVGANLEAIEKSLMSYVCGCDVNELALEIAAEKGLSVYRDDATNLSCPNDRFEMVFTCGLMIHMRSADMIRCMKEMNRKSSRMVMIMEYMGDDIATPYRGDRLFKRDYGNIYNALFPEAVLVRTGFLPQEMGFDDVTYWIFYGTRDCASEDGFKEVARQGDAESRGKDFAPSPAVKTGEIGTT